MLWQRMIIILKLSDPCFNPNIERDVLSIILLNFYSYFTLFINASIWYLSNMSERMSVLCFLALVNRKNKKLNNSYTKI